MQAVLHTHTTEVLFRPSHVDELLSQTVAAQKRENSRCLMKLLENIVFLGRQGLGLRGDSNDKTGNFYQLVCCEQRMTLLTKREPSGRPRLRSFD